MTINLFGREIVIKKSLLILLIIAVSIVLGCIGILITRSGRDIIIEDKSTITSGASGKAEISADNASGKAAGPATTDGSQVLEDGAATGKPEKQENETIKVYVVGCVKKPGVITLKKGQIIDDAVKCAGGLTEEADASSINMVYILNENVMLRICSKKESVKAVQSSSQNQIGNSNNTGSSNTTDDKLAGKGVKVVKDSGSAIVTGQGTEQDSTSAGGSGSGKININTASEAELDTLPGIGEATARDIIAYREKNGPFKDIKDIMKIPRIKDSRFNAIKDLIAAN